MRQNKLRKIYRELYFVSWVPLKNSRTPGISEKDVLDRTSFAAKNVRPFDHGESEYRRHRFSTRTRGESDFQTILFSFFFIRTHRRYTDFQKSLSERHEPGRASSQRAYTPPRARAVARGQTIRGGRGFRGPPAGTRDVSPSDRSSTAARTAGGAPSRRPGVPGLISHSTGEKRAGRNRRFRFPSLWSGSALLGDASRTDSRRRANAPRSGGLVCSPRRVVGRGWRR